MAFVECLEPKTPSANVTKWPPERLALLRQYVLEQKSATEIAILMDTTRNSICGICHREGLKRESQSKFRPRTPKPPKPPKAKTSVPVVNLGKRKAPKLELIATPISDLDIPQEQRKTFMQLGPHDCRWGVGNVGEKDFFFCGGETKDDRSYCAHHHRLSISERRR